MLNSANFEIQLKIKYKMNGLNLTFNGIDLTQLAQDVQEIKSLVSGFCKPELEEELLTFNEGCELLKCTRVTLWKYAKLGKIKTYKIGNKVFLKRSELMEVISNNVTKK